MRVWVVAFVDFSCFGLAGLECVGLVLITWFVWWFGGLGAVYCWLVGGTCFLYCGFRCVCLAGVSG